MGFAAEIIVLFQIIAEALETLRDNFYGGAVYSLLIYPGLHIYQQRRTIDGNANH